MHPDPGMTTTAPRYRIVVALDLSEYAEVVLEHGLDQAAQHDAPDLHFVTVTEHDGDRDDVKNRLGALVLQGLDGFNCCEWHARLHVRTGRPAEEIADLAAELRAHLIVVGRFGLSHPRKKLGSVANRVIEAASCPTLVVGMVDQSPDQQVQCPACVAVRAESDGERWFCDAHAMTDQARFTAVVGPSTLTGSGPMW
jgi:nucleotide-binding universal stress UspA family protein